MRDHPPRPMRDHPPRPTPDAARRIDDAGTALPARPAVMSATRRTAGSPFRPHTGHRNESIKSSTENGLREMQDAH